MDVTLINRIGIVLNFLAGFMLAPELLGVERLRKVENYIDKWALVTKHRIDVVLMGTKRMFRLIGVRSLTASVIHTILQLIGMYTSLSSNNPINTILAIGYCIASFIIFYLFIKVYAYPEKRVNYKNMYHFFSSSITMFFIMPSINFSLILSTPFLCLIAILNTAIGYILRKLEGQERLRSILVWWGIIFFIIGNALQFISTF